MSHASDPRGATAPTASSAPAGSGAAGPAGGGASTASTARAGAAGPGTAGSTGGAAASAPSAESQSFEDAARRLGKIVEQLEAGELPLERSLELFEEGVRLARSAQERLDRAERRVEELLGIDAHGKPVVRDFEG